MLGRRRFGRPGLLGTIARTAVISGTATMTANAVNRRSQARAEQQREAELYEQQQMQAQMPPPAPVAPPVAAPAADDVVGRLSQLAELHRMGALSDTEFAAAKDRLLS
jgi:hypothetical protein